MSRKKKSEKKYKRAKKIKKIRFPSCLFENFIYARCTLFSVQCKQWATSRQIRGIHFKKTWTEKYWQRLRTVNIACDVWNYELWKASIRRMKNERKILVRKTLNNGFVNSTNMWTFSLMLFKYAKFHHHHLWRMKNMY